MKRSVDLFLLSKEDSLFFGSFLSYTGFIITYSEKPPTAAYWIVQFLHGVVLLSLVGPSL